MTSVSRRDGAEWRVRLFVWCCAVGSGHMRCQGTPETECCPDPVAGPLTGDRYEPGETTVSNGGIQVTTLYRPGTTKAGAGPASLTGSGIRVTNEKDRKYSPGVTGEHAGKRPLLPGGALAMFVDLEDPCDFPEETGCREKTFDQVDVHGLGTSVTACVCDPVQVGGPNLDHGARFVWDRQVLDPSIGSPVVFDSQRTGAELWWFHATHPTDQYAEVRHYDGTIERYEPTPLPFVDGARGLTGQYWELAWVRDPFDNQTDYVYDGQHVLQRVEYPGGLVEHWNWSPAWLATYWPTQHSALEIWFEDTAGQQDLSSLTYAMVFENDGQVTHFGGRMVAHFAQRVPVVATPAAGQVYDVATSRLTVEATVFVYETAPAGDYRVAEVHKHWVPVLANDPVTEAFAPPSGVPVPVVQTTYDPVSGKVVRNTLPQLGPAGLDTYYDYTRTPTYAQPLPPDVTLENRTGACGWSPRRARGARSSRSRRRGTSACSSGCCGCRDGRLSGRVPRENPAVASVPPRAAAAHWEGAPAEEMFGLCSGRR